MRFLILYIVQLSFLLCVDLAYSLSIKRVDHSNLSRNERNWSRRIAFRNSGTRNELQSTPSSSLFQLRSGNLITSIPELVLSSPSSLFDSLLIALAAIAVIGKTASSVNQRDTKDDTSVKPASVRVLQVKFLGTIGFHILFIGN